MPKQNKKLDRGPFEGSMKIESVEIACNTMDQHQDQFHISTTQSKSDWRTTKNPLKNVVMASTYSINGLAFRWKKNFMLGVTSTECASINVVPRRFSWRDAADSIRLNSILRIYKFLGV
uniref:Uncharacterized protein n=1 Tax=Entomoneis paludosa TaxID=265537 RepID=A0A7S2VE43_9STRA|mmetsp:Transcript_18920/g.39182  ORF Transcript_18920/g.39182 Transcript_18920/m.39182 type:complete len:119 (+) Transcript_18920:89-445(+)